MPEFNIKDTIITSLSAQEPWPDNVKLFQPYEVEQILLPDNASCLAVQAFLKMCNLPFEVEMRWNAEFMSPSGRVPFIKCGAFVVSELEPIVQFAANKGVSLCSQLSGEEKAEMRAYMSLITNVLVNAELYISWLDEDTFNTVTKVRNSSVYPWPLGWLQTRSKRNTVAKRLKALHWHDKTLDQVLADVEQCCNSLSQRLGEKDFFFGTPTPLDTLLYGHVRALLSAVGPRAPYMIKPITSSLLKHTIRITKMTAMPLTAQEDYLIAQAFNVTVRRRLSPERTYSERSTRSRRSRVSVRHVSQHNVCQERDVYGFKPFASKQIIIMTSDEGAMTCHNNAKSYDKIAQIDDETYAFIIDILSTLIDKSIDVSEKAFEIARDHQDFEVIVHPTKVNSFMEPKENEFLDTIEENDLTDTTVSVDLEPEEILHVINDGDDLMIDSDGLVNDKRLSTEAFDDFNDSTEGVDGTADCSISQELTEAYNTMKQNENIETLKSGTPSTTNMSLKTESSLSRLFSGSKSTLRIPSNEEISVESLLRYLRKRNADYNTFRDVVDVD